MRYSVGDAVWASGTPGDRPDTMRAGVVYAVHLGDTYPYEVEVCGVPPGPKGVGHRFCFAEGELAVRRA